jgi:hypothetical protein
MIETEDTRAEFEEFAYNEYFVRTIVLNPRPIGMQLISTAKMTPAELCVTHLNKHGVKVYTDDAVEQMWVGWQGGIKHMNRLREDEL